MKKPSNHVECHDVNNANNLSISFAFLMPSGVAEVSAFLFGAAFALGGREADLARMLGVSPATLSSWKSRGAIPQQHRQWFLDQFPVLVLGTMTPAPGDDFRHAGLPAALSLVRESNFNPFALSVADDVELLDTLSNHFGGIVRLCHFVQHRLSIEDAFGDQLYSQVASIVGDVARAAAPVIFGARTLSQ